MTLATVPRYEPDAVSDVGEHAVVVGGSIAGLLSARVLADGFERVTVLERDELPDDPSARQGVPQGQHIHVLQEAGRATFEDLFPGYGEDLLGAGGVLIDALSDLRHYERGDLLADGQTRLPMYCATRPLLEHHLRQRVAGRDGVTLRPGCRGTDYRLDDAGTTVEGVEVRDGGGLAELPADLVVDATGRASRTPSWLADHGFTAPDVEEVHVDVAYSSVVIERPAGDRRGFFVPPEPPRTRAAGVSPIEGDRWIVTLMGIHGDDPPTDPAGVREYAESLPLSAVGRLLDTQPWVTDEVTHYPFPSNVRRRYEDLDRFPAGLLVVGDAVSSFNPIYGQGMSVAALDALALHHTLAADDRDDLAGRFFDRVADIVDVPWSIAVGGDFEFPQTTGPKPTGTDFFNRYLARLVRKAHSDGDLREALVRVFMMERPPESLLRPRVAWRVLKPTRPTLGSRTRSPAGRRSGETL